MLKLATMSTPPLTIVPATMDDLSDLVRLHTTCYVTDPFTAILFKDWPSTRTLTMLVNHRITGSLQDHDAVLFKAIDDSSGELVGFVTLTTSLGGDGRVDKVVEGIQLPETVAKDVLVKNVLKMQEGQEALHGLKFLGIYTFVRRKEKSYSLTSIALTSLCVDPQYQRQGIGNKLIERCIEVSNDENIPIYLNASPAASSLYLRSGFEQVRYFDIDLGAYGKKYRGYGIYRNYAMLRKPDARKNVVA